MTSFVDELTEAERTFLDKQLDEGYPVDGILWDFEKQFGKKLGRSSVYDYRQKRLLKQAMQTKVEGMDGIKEKELPEDIDIYAVAENDLKRIVKLESKRDLTALENSNKLKYLQLLADFQKSKIEKEKPQVKSLAEVLAVSPDPYCEDKQPWHVHKHIRLTKVMFDALKQAEIDGHGTISDRTFEVAVHLTDADVRGVLYPLCGKCNNRHSVFMGCASRLGDPKLI